MSSQSSWILAGARTPIGRFLGALKELPAPELAAVAIRAAVERSGVDEKDVEEVILGNVLTAGVGQAPARQAALRAGLSSQVAAVTVNKVCGSGLKAVMLADQAIRCGDARCIVAGGMESMSRAPHIALGSREGWKLGNIELKDALILDGLWCGTEQCHMGTLADWTATHCSISREQMDAFAVESQRRATAAMASGAFAEEIVPVTVRQKRDELRVVQDESPRAETSLEGLGRLKPVFDPKGSVTAGNASPISDGAAAVVVTDEATAMRSAAPWRARILAAATSGGPPREIFLAPALAIRKVLEKSGLTLDEIDLFEINEAFAVQMLACLQALKLDVSRVNVHGGAIALGHPIGASGARVLCTLLSALKQRGLRRGLASLCLGGGNAVAMIVERA